MSLRQLCRASADVVYGLEQVASTRPALETESRWCQILWGASAMHQTEIHPDIIDLIKQKRGGKLHVHDALDPARTALVVVDMQVAFLKPGLPSEVPRRGCPRGQESV